MGIEMKVLIIEDNPTDMKLMGTVLKMSGHIVRERTSAEEAADAIAGEKPDVILLDLHLPCMDGLTLARQLKANADTRSIPILAVTAYPDRYQRDVLLAAGCDACITKPINTRELANTLEEAVERESR
jgi:CheY-like chemotaxis protein